ncbi:hypothetical protein YC2023_055465 [Brassica napus]
MDRPILNHKYFLSKWVSPTTYMAKFGFNQLGNRRHNKLKCLGLRNWGKTRFPFFSPSPAILLLLNL